MPHKTDDHWIAHALTLANHAAKQNEVPVGAILVQDNQIIAEGWNQPIAHHDPTAHAEIVTLRKAANKIKNYRLINSTLYVTLEPCVMCIGAILHARIDRLVYGARDPRAGAIESVFRVVDEPRLNHRIDCKGGVMADACGQILKDFFKQRR